MGIEFCDVVDTVRLNLMACVGNSIEGCDEILRNWFKETDLKSLLKPERAENSSFVHAQSIQERINDTQLDTMNFNLISNGRCTTFDASFTELACNKLN